MLNPSKAGHSSTDRSSLMCLLLAAVADAYKFCIYMGKDPEVKIQVQLAFYFDFLQNLKVLYITEFRLPLL